MLLLECTNHKYKIVLYVNIKFMHNKWQRNIHAHVFMFKIYDCLNNNNNNNNIIIIIIIITIIIMNNRNK